MADPTQVKNFFAWTHQGTLLFIYYAQFGVTIKCFIHF